MSILGVKKNRIDTIENKMARINIDLQTINSNKKEAHKGISNIILRVNNNEKLININKNKPDRKIICIYAGAEGPLYRSRMFTFGDDRESFVTPYPGQILSMSFISLKSGFFAARVYIVINDKVHGGITTFGGDPKYLEFKDPIKVEAGDLIGFVSTIENHSTSNTLVSAIIELFI